MRLAAASIAQGERNRRRILEAVVISKEHGISTPEIRRTLRLGDSSVGEHLRALLAEGKVAKAPKTGATSRWYLPGLEPEITRRPPSQRRYERVSAEFREWVEEKPVMRVVPAGSKKPPFTTGVRSVWELA